MKEIAAAESWRRCRVRADTEVLQAYGDGEPVSKILHAGVHSAARTAPTDRY